MTPANALRVLQAQLQVAGRAIGSIFVPALTAILPPAIAVVKVIGEAANALARFFGFEMPTIDYSSLTQMPTVEVSNDIDDITSSMDDYTDSVNVASKATKTLIGGFDELNILKSPNEASSSLPDTSLDTGKAEIGSILGDIELPEYDMLLGGVESEIDEWVDRIKDAIGTATTYIKPFIPLLEGLGTAIAVAFAVKELKKFRSFMGELPGMNKTIGALKSGFSVFRTELKNTSGQMGKLKGFTTSAKKGLDTFRASVPTAVKAAVGIGGIAANFMTASNAIEAATLKTEGWETQLGLSVASFGVVEGLLYAFCSPWAAVAGAVAGAMGALKGFDDAQKQMREEIFLEDFFSTATDSISTMNDGLQDVSETTKISISEMSDQFKLLSDTIVQSNTPILEGRDTIEESRKSVKNTSTEIGYLITSMENGTISVKEAVPQIQQQFEQLETGTKETLDAIYSNIYRALSGSVGDSLTKIGYDVPELMGVLSELEGKTTSTLDTLSREYNNLVSQLNSGQGEPTEIRKELSRIVEEMQTLSGTASPSVEAFNNAISTASIDSLDIGSVEEFNSAIEGMGTAATNAKNSITESYGEIQAELKNMLGIAEYFGYDDIAAEIRTAIDNIPLAMQNEISSIDDAMRSAATKIQQSFFTQFNAKAKEQAPTFWEEIVNAVFKGNDSSLQYMVSSSLLESFGTLDETFMDVFGGYADNSLTGYSQGMLKNEYIGTNATKVFGRHVGEAFGESLDSHSPSKVFEDYGLWSVQGYARGLSGSQEAITSCKEMANEVMKTAKNELSRDEFRKIGQEAVKGINDGLKGIKFPEIEVPHFEISYDTWGYDAKVWKEMGMPGKPEVDVKWYSRGGIFDSPQIIGVGEKGREAVVPLEDNSPWIKALAENVSTQVSIDNDMGSERILMFIDAVADRIIEAIQENGNVVVQNNLDSDALVERILVKKGGRR